MGFCLMNILVIQYLTVVSLFKFWQIFTCKFFLKFYCKSFNTHSRHLTSKLICQMKYRIWILESTMLRKHTVKELNIPCLCFPSPTFWCILVANIHCIYHSVFKTSLKLHVTKKALLIAFFKDFTNEKPNFFWINSTYPQHSMSFWLYLQYL